MKIRPAAALAGACAAAASAFSVAGGLVAAFLAAATIGGWLPGPAPLSTGNAFDGRPGRTIILLESPLHTDILLPADPDVRARFGFLRGSRVPLNHPALRWLSFGWGSRAFYTTAGSYADIAPGAVWKAATGDAAVMRVVGLPAIDASSLRRIALSSSGFERLLTRIASSFAVGPDGTPVKIDASIGPDDAFYAATGRFSLFHPCNEWTRKALRAAGVPAGRWTPTAHSLALALDRHDRGVQP